MSYTVGKLLDSTFQYTYKLWETRGTRTCILVHVMGALAVGILTWAKSIGFSRISSTCKHGLQEHCSSCSRSILCKTVEMNMFVMFRAATLSTTLTLSKIKSNSWKFVHTRLRLRDVMESNPKLVSKWLILSTCVFNLNENTPCNFYDFQFMGTPALAYFVLFNHQVNQPDDTPYFYVSSPFY